jgi:hypothetical protein
MRKNLVLSQNFDRQHPTANVYPNYTREGSIEENKSSETMVSGRHMQEHYQQLLRPRGMDMFSSQVYKSEGETKENGAQRVDEYLMINKTVV